MLRNGTCLNLEFVGISVAIGVPKGAPLISGRFCAGFLEIGKLSSLVSGKVFPLWREINATFDLAGREKLYHLWGARLQLKCTKKRIYRVEAAFS
jgi:hypothetical protein